MSHGNTTWDADGISAEAVLAWARSVAEGATQTSVILAWAEERESMSMDGRATVLHHDVTAVGTFTVVLWADRPSDGRPGGDYVVRHEVTDDGAGNRRLVAPTGTAEAARYLAEHEPSAEPKPRPRVRVLDAFDDRYPVLVLDRWTGDPADVRRLDAREIGFSGVLVFAEDVDLDDDGLDDEPDALVRARDKVLGIARDLAELHGEGRDTAAAREHLAQAVKDLDEMTEGSR